MITITGLNIEIFHPQVIVYLIGKLLVCNIHPRTLLRRLADELILNWKLILVN
jgi:hypothetical protein